MRAERCASSSSSCIGFRRKKSMRRSWTRRSWGGGRGGRRYGKYGRTIEGALSLRAELAGKIEELERATVDLSALQKQITPLEREVKALGEELSGKRKAAAKKLVPLVEKQLAELGMEKAVLRVEF